MVNASHSWLQEVVEAAGVAGGESVGIDSKGTPDEAWQEVAERSGISTEQLQEMVANHFGLPVADLKLAEPTARTFVPAWVALKHQVLPLRADYGKVFVATSDPTNLDAEQDIAFAAGRGVAFEIVAPGDLAEAVYAVYAPDREVESVLDSLEGTPETSVHLLETELSDDIAAEDAMTAPVIRLTNLLLIDAIRRGASDIHFQPKGNGGLVRFRIDGVLHDHTRVPLSALNRIVSRVKVMGRLDITNRLRPQDGRSRVRVGEGVFDLRISTIPTREAEKAVIRILDPEGAATGLGTLGILQPELEGLQRLLTFREGIVVVTGPTGSGKTTTLYAALRQLASEAINIVTVEDPVEYELPGLTQIQVEEQQGLTFASALRSILRQDPDVIFVGEIRDAETAAIALQASMTGHLVFATLHTNDAIGAIPRLQDLGLDAASVSSALRGCVAQRLARRVCLDCATPAEPPLTEAEERFRETWTTGPSVRAVGCERCGQTGYRGRIPFVEVLVKTPEIEQLILDGTTHAELARAAVEAGMRPLYEVALERVRAGETTLEEFERVIGEVKSDETDSQAAKAAPHGPSTGDGEEQKEGPGHVLVVDDDGAYRTIARALLEKEGYLVTDVDDGSGALEALSQEPLFHLMVLDLDMREIGGREVLQRIRAAPETADLPVIVLTGSADPDSEIKLLETGADDYLRKPMDPELFMVRVKATLRRSHRGES